MRKCRKCKLEKPESEFRDWGGQPGKTCATCFRRPVAEAEKKAKKKKPKLTQAAAPPELVLEFPAGYGFSARTEADAICILQKYDGGDDTVWLSRAEFATLIAHFGAWAGEKAE